MPVLIASTGLDKPVYGPVAEGLERRGHEVLVYNTDEVVTGRVPFSIYTHGRFLYGDRTVAFNDIQAVWYRHPGFIGLEFEDKAKMLMLEREVASLQDHVWSAIPEHKWLNAPANLQKARDKIGQLALAESIGFHIPETVITNRWSDVDEKFGNQDVVIKMSRGYLYEHNRALTLYTTRVSATKRMELSNNLPFPAIIQNYIPKSREWRVTVVGDELFSAAIYADSDAQDDWRKLMFTDKVRFELSEIPDDISKKCHEYLGALSLRYGAFDIIETPNGTFVFLECNPNGQYMWLEEALKLPISGAIVKQLSRIAEGG